MVKNVTGNSVIRARLSDVAVYCSAAHPLMRLCTPHSRNVLMIKEMTTLESREGKGGEKHEKEPVVVCGRQRNPEFLATSRASFLERLPVWLCLAPASFIGGPPFICIQLITTSMKQSWHTAGFAFWVNFGLLETASPAHFRALASLLVRRLPQGWG